MNESLKGSIGPLPDGLLRIHSNGVGVIDVTNPDKRHAATIVNQLNTPRYQKEVFYNPNHPNHLHSKTFPDGSSVTLYDQSAKYSEISALVIAHGPETFERGEDELVPVEFVYDYPEKVQQTYWQTLFGGMKAFQENTQHMKGMRVFIGENNISTYSTDDNRTSRSIGNPHAHIIGFLEEHVEQSDPHKSKHVQHLAEEQEFTKRLSTHITRRVHNRLPESIQDQITLMPQEQPPFGYSFALPYSIDDILVKPQEFATLMAEHHEAYTTVSQQMEKAYAPRVLAAGFKQFIPQPSYRLYLEEVDGQLYAAISPEYLSHAGIMEAASYGLILDRDASHPQRLSKNLVEEAQQDAAKYINDVLTIYNP